MLHYERLRCFCNQDFQISTLDLFVDKVSSNISLLLGVFEQEG